LNTTALRVWGNIIALTALRVHIAVDVLTVAREVVLVARGAEPWAGADVITAKRHFIEL
jgi:hypothetical protein